MKIKNVDKVLNNLEKLRIGEWIGEWIDYNSAKFHEDWISNRNLEWDEILKGLLKEVIRVKRELSDLPKGPSDYEDHSLDPFSDEFSVKEERIRVVKKLADLEEGINNSLVEYENKKNQSPYVITYSNPEKIPFVGNEQAFTSLIGLLVEAGFLGVTGKHEKAISKNLKSSNRTIFKNKFITKKKLSQLVSSYFYCIDTGKNYDKITELIVKPKSVESKLSLENLKRLDDDVLIAMSEKVQLILNEITTAMKTKKKD